MPGLKNNFSLPLGGGGAQVGFKIRHLIPTPWPPSLICYRLVQGLRRGGGGGQARQSLNGHK